VNESHHLVMDILFGRWRSQILYAGVKLGVFNTLSAGPKRADDVASEFNLNRPLTYPLLRALASLGLLSEAADCSFSLTPSGEFLRADHPQTLRGIVLLEDGPEHYAV
jgi:predicted transcriptional regulator